MPSVQERNHELGHAPVGELLTRYSVPATMGLMVHALYGVVDAFFIGRGVPNGGLALAGLQVCMPVQIFNMALMMTIALGAASVVSRSLGAGDRDRARHAAGTALMAVLLIGLTVSALGLRFLTPLLRLCGASDEVVPFGYEYLSVILLGNVFLSFSLCAHQLVRAEGNVVTSMIAMLIGSGMNIALDPVFIFGLDMGIRGAAVATVIAQVLAFCFLLRHLLSGESALKLQRGSLTVNADLLPEILVVGSSSFVRMGGGAVVGVVANRAIAHYGEPVHMAAMGLFMRINRFLLMPMLGTLHGMRPILGFNYGAGKPARVLRATKVGLVRLTTIATCGFLLLMLLPGPVLSLFTPEGETELVVVGARIIRIMAMLMPLMGLQIFAPNLFQSIGKGGPALLLSLTRRLLFIVPLILVLSHFFGLDGVWYAFPTSAALSTVVMVIWLVREVRILRRSAEAGC
jgi:putative MATE family efflux protein